jgi:lipopolysaccharide export LptBFGC system permease protein LptF
MIKSIITAEKAKWQKDHWELIDGKEYKIGSDGVYNNIVSFDKRETIPAETSPNAYKLMINSVRNQKEMTFSELNNYNKLLKRLDLQEESNYILTKFHQRFSQPFSCILLALCGVILGFSKPREKRLIGFTIGVAIIFLYYLIVPFLDMLSQTGIISPFISAWTPNILIFITLIMLIKHKQI